MTLVAIAGHQEAKSADSGTSHGATKLFRQKCDRWHHLAEIITLECLFHRNEATKNLVSSYEIDLY